MRNNQQHSTAAAAAGTGYNGHWVDREREGGTTSGMAPMAVDRFR